MEYKLIIVDLVWYLGQGALHCYYGLPLLPFVQRIASLFWESDKPDQDVNDVF